MSQFEHRRQELPPIEAFSLLARTHVSTIVLSFISLLCSTLKSVRDDTCTLLESSPSVRIDLGNVWIVDVDCRTTGITEDVLVLLDQEKMRDRYDEEEIRKRSREIANLLKIY